MRRKKPRTCGSSVSCKRRRKTASVPVTSPSGGKDCRFPAMRPTPEEPLALSGVATGYEAASMVFLLMKRGSTLVQTACLGSDKRFGRRGNDRVLWLDVKQGRPSEPKSALRSLSSSRGSRDDRPWD